METLITIVTTGLFVVALVVLSFILGMTWERVQWNRLITLGVLPDPTQASDWRTLEAFADKKKT